MTTPKTKPSTSEAESEPLVPGARHAVVPKGITATSWPRVKATCRNIGWGFDPWQDATGRLILAKSANGRWAADLSIMSIPRQVGKSYLLGCIIFALCLLNPRLRVIWTSHHTATTEEMYEAMKELAAHKRVAPHVVKCIALQGSRWRIQFRNGSRIDFGARSQGFGRGKAKVGVLVLDEFQHISSRALANLAPTTNTSDNPLILCAGTPPGPEANGEAFRMRRKAALEGLSDDTLYVEFSADSDADPDDRKQWAKANPSFPKRTKERAFLLLKKILDPEDYLREGLGIWSEAASDGIFPTWPNLTGEPEVPTAFGIAADVDVTRFVLGGATTMFVDVVTPQAFEKSGPQVPAASRSLFVAEVKRIAGSLPVALQERGPAWILKDDLESAGVRVVPVTFDEFVQGCSDFDEVVAAAQVRHGGQPELSSAVKAAKWRTVGDRRVISRKSADIPELEAVILARHIAESANYNPLASVY